MTLCDPMDYTVHGILQARILEWAAIPSPTDLPDPEINPGSPALQVDSLAAELPGKPIYINHQPTVLLTNLQSGQGATGQLVFAPCRGRGGDGAPSYSTHPHGSQAGLLPAGSSARCSQWPWLLSPSHPQATGLPHSTAARFPQQHPKGWGEACPHPSLTPGTLVDQKSWTDRQTEGSRDAESLPGQEGKVLHPFRVLMGHWSWGKRQDWGEGGGRWQGTAVI